MATVTSTPEDLIIRRSIGLSQIRSGSVLTVTRRIIPKKNALN